MAIATNALDEIRGLLEGEGSSAERVANLRKAFPGLSLTRCDAGDMDTETPILETAGFAVYLIDTSEHCVRITTQPEAATGLILAEKR
ncbi:hypothetical protein [Methylococcus sp. EFPC2]|uniref:hypothetical protein n=1 Tax=Methylococcus sp. EFPC2 TaxID=2812648 RepID=UPI0019689834|nr:hypothetical protein [Methylococcus sp. EFPC2]QSA99310.1 hypothetical protein JWZ97_19430 [Methylococcus sp. EFPC2]